MKTSHYISMAGTAIAFASCVTAPSSVAPKNFSPNSSYLDGGMPVSTEPGFAPASLNGATWTFACSEAYGADDESPESDVKQFDRSCAFAGNKIETKTIKYFYYKTGANTATMIHWYACEDAGVIFGDSMFEMRLTFTDEKSGHVQFATCGHGFDYYGCGTFTIQR